MSEEVSEKQLNAILATANEWYEAFAKSPEFERDRYDPCPCGSGKKYKFCCERQG